MTLSFRKSHFNGIVNKSGCYGPEYVINTPSFFDLHPTNQLRLTSKKSKLISRKVYSVKSTYCNECVLENSLEQKNGFNISFNYLEYVNVLQTDIVVQKKIREYIFINIIHIVFPQKISNELFIKTESDLFTKTNFRNQIFTWLRAKTAIFCNFEVICGFLLFNKLRRSFPPNDGTIKEKVLDFVICCLISTKITSDLHRNNDFFASHFDISLKAINYKEAFVIHHLNYNTIIRFTEFCDFIQKYNTNYR
ncbi:hypothetical protein NUSPORA_01453 [Nucleospora cyclopteri]